MVLQNTTSDWLYANITLNRHHNSKHFLNMQMQNEDDTYGEIAIAQSLSLMISNPRYDASSTFLTYNQSLLNKAIHEKGYELLSNPKFHNTLMRRMQDKRPISLNIKMPIIPNSSTPQLLGGIHLQLDRTNILYNQTATNTFAVILNPNNEYDLPLILDNLPASDFELALEDYHIASVYPTIDYRPGTIGIEPLYKPVNLQADMTHIVNYIDPNLLSNMPMYERMAWLTSDNAENKANHISRTLNRHMHFLTLEDVGNTMTASGEHIYGHRIRVDDTQAQYAPEDPRFNKSRNMLWHDLTEYNGDNELMQNMRDRYIWLLDNTDDLQHGMHRTQSDDYSY